MLTSADRRRPHRRGVCLRDPRRPIGPRRVAAGTGGGRPGAGADDRLRAIAARGLPAPAWPGALFAVPFDRSGSAPARAAGLADGAVRAVESATTRSNSWRRWMRSACCARSARSRRSPSATTSIATATSARSPAARSRRWRASAIRRRRRSSRQLIGRSSGPRASDATALAVAFARERMLKDGSIAVIQQAARRQVAPQPGARLSRRARRAACRDSAGRFLSTPHARRRARPDRQGPRLQGEARRHRRRDRRGRGLHRRGRSRVSRGGRPDRRATRRSTVRPAAPTCI